MQKILIISIIIILTSCDLVSTREPEKPNSQATSYEPATTQTILFNNLINSFNEKSIDDYISCFVSKSYSSEDFIFIPTQERVADFVAWTLDSERSYFQNMISNLNDEQKPILTLVEKQNTQFGNKAVYLYDYTISFPDNNYGIPALIQGTSQFTVIRDQREQWVIQEWIDYQLEGKTSWSELKRLLY